MKVRSGGSAAPLERLPGQGQGRAVLACDPIEGSVTTTISVPVSFSASRIMLVMYSRDSSEMMLASSVMRPPSLRAADRAEAPPQGRVTSCTRRGPGSTWPSARLSLLACTPDVSSQRERQRLPAAFGGAETTTEFISLAWRAPATSAGDAMDAEAAVSCTTTVADDSSACCGRIAAEGKAGEPMTAAQPRTAKLVRRLLRSIAAPR